MPLPWMHLRPASITSHFELSIMIGTRAISGSLAIRLRKRTIAALLSSMASSMLTSITWAPFSTCWRATASAFSNSPLRISRAKALEPVTLVRSPMLTNSVPSPMATGSRPAGHLLVARGTLLESEAQRQQLIARGLYVDETDSDQFKKALAGKLDSLVRQNALLGQIARAQPDASDCARAAQSARRRIGDPI